MDNKLKILLDKIQIEEEYIPLFETATLKKIVVNRNQKEWVVFITLKDYLPIDVYLSLEREISKCTRRKRWHAPFKSQQ